MLDAVNLVAGEESDGDGVVDVEVDTAVVVGQYATRLQQTLEQGRIGSADRLVERSVELLVRK